RTTTMRSRPPARASSEAVGSEPAVKRTRALPVLGTPAACLLCLSLAGSSADALASAAPAAAKGDGHVTIADWLDLARKVVDAVNELFPSRAAPARVIAGPVGLPKIAQQFDQQYGPRIRQVYRSELHLMRMACQPTREQYDKISAAGEEDLKEVV